MNCPFNISWRRPLRLGTEFYKLLHQSQQRSALVETLAGEISRTVLPLWKPCPYQRNQPLLTLSIQNEEATNGLYDWTQQLILFNANSWNSDHDLISLKMIPDIQARQRRHTARSISGNDFAYG